MATPPVLDPEELLAPIPGDNPSGEDLAYEPEYDALKEARRSEDDTLQGDWLRTAKVAQWDQVIQLGRDYLRGRTKDLQVAAWLAEGLARAHGLAGLRDGLRLMKALMDRFWETCYPVVEDGDLEGRAAALAFLNQDKLLPLLIRGLPLTDDPSERLYSFLKYQESRATDNAGLRNPELMQTLIAEGKITTKQFDEAVAMTPRAFYETTFADLEECREALKELDRASDERFGREAPGLGAIRKALDDCRSVVLPILNAKRQQEPDEDAPAAGSAEAPAPAEGVAQEEGRPADAPARRPSARRGGSAAGPIADAEDAFGRILDAAAFLRQNERGSPVPYLVVRALRMAEVFGMSRPPDPSGLPGPASESRQALKRLAAEGDWGALLEEAEQALGRPEGRAWLDPHRLALRALGESGLDAAAAAVRALLRAFLAEFPGLPRAELADDTPAANAETRAWLEAEILPRVESPAPAPEPAPEPEPPAYVPEPPRARADGEPAEPDAWDRAVDLVDAGRLSDGLQLVRRAMAAAPTGREKFRRKLQMAELCLRGGNPRVAQPLLEELARQVDEFHLEQWEDESWIARVWGGLYRCLRAAGAEAGSDDRLKNVYMRLCRIDINHALIYGDGAAGRP